MDLYESNKRLGTMGNRRDGRSNNETDPDHPDFGSSCLPIIQSPEHVEDHSELLNGKNTSFTAWTIKLCNDGQLKVEGTLKCGRRACTKPIIQRIDASQVLSKSNHIYQLVGNVSDSLYELPGFVRHRFHTGFPEDWEIVVGIWQSYDALGCNRAVRPSPMSQSVIVRKKLKLALDDPMDSDCFLECARGVTRIRSESRSTDESMKENCANSELGTAISNTKIKESVVDYKSRDHQGLKTMGELRRLVAWTPFILPRASVEYCLAFRGTLLSVLLVYRNRTLCNSFAFCLSSSMGLPVNKNHRTDAVRRRISARIIETVNRELYELNGDLNNTKHHVPKELVLWCRHGCPKEINLFCKNWRILRSNENMYYNVSLQGKKRMDQNHDRGAVIPTCHDKSVNSNEDCTIDWTSNMRLRENNKRKRIQTTELNDISSISDTGVEDDTGCNEKPGATLNNNSPVTSRPKIRRRMFINLLGISKGDVDIAKDESSKRIGRVRHDIEEQRSTSRQATTLSYVYRKCSTNTESILSDDV